MAEASKSVAINYESDESEGQPCGYSNVPGYTKSDIDKMSEYSDEKPKKSARQLRHEADLAARGKLRPPTRPGDRFGKIPGFEHEIQKYYEKTKPYCGDRVAVVVTHLVTARMVYIRQTRTGSDPSDYDIGFVKIQKKLADIYGGINGQYIPPLPRNMMVHGTACVVKFNDEYYRARITGGVCRSGVTVILSDVGKSVAIGNGDYGQLKVLVREGENGWLNNPELVFHCKIANVCEVALSSQELNVLKELLPVGTKLAVKFDRKKPATVPAWRMHFGFGDQATFQQYFVQELAKRRIPSTYQMQIKDIELQRARIKEQQAKEKEIKAEARRRAGELRPRGPAFKIDQDDRDETESIYPEERLEVVRGWLDRGPDNGVDPNQPGLSLEHIKMEEEEMNAWREADSLPDE